MKKEDIPYLRVGTAILKRVLLPLSNGRSLETLIPWNVETLRQDFGKDYIAKIPKYDGFCTVPCHTDYRQEIHGFLNRYEPITTIPAEGKFPHVREFLAHIFGEQVELGYDYLQLLDQCKFSVERLRIFWINTKCICRILICESSCDTKGLL